MNVKKVLIDTALIYGLIVVCAVLHGLSFGALNMKSTNGILIAIAGTAFANIIGFFIVGIRVTAGRFKHLLYVSLMYWLIFVIGTSFLGSISPRQFATTLFFVLVTMLIGGGLSFLIARPQQQAA